jgi:hypothetical protein
MPTSLGLGNPHTPSNNTALLWREPEDNSSLSSQTPTKGSLSDSESIRYPLRDNPILNVTPYYNFAFGFDETLLNEMIMASITETTTRGITMEEGSGAYRMNFFAGAGGGVGRYEGNGTLPRGSGLVPGSPSQPYLGRGPYDDPLGGPLGGGGNPGGGDGEGHLNPPPQGGALTPPMHSSLKGTPPAIFNGNCKNTKQFMQEFTLYCLINKDTLMMRNAYTCTTLALSFMRGPAINNWVLQ